ncbi:MAG TPA: ABC transporter permease subunit [Gammaproteobacteria bacterium]|nr:ABC transporter permease subunit [Gammaproteobacteria bacterium]
MMIFTIAARELRSLFLSPLAWSVLAVVQFILAYLFLAQVDNFMTLQPQLVGLEGAPGVTDLIAAPLLGDAAIVLLLVTPLITMRILSEERRNGTLSLLFSAPVSMTEIVLGKYLGLLGFFFILLAMLVAMPLSLLAGTPLDLGKLAAGVLGLGLLLAAFCAAGLYLSSLTEQPTVAAISTFGLLLLLWIIDWAGKGGDEVSGLLHYLSLLRHYEPLLRGLVHSTDVLYYLLFIIIFLGLSIRRLDADRLSH